MQWRLGEASRDKNRQHEAQQLQAEPLFGLSQSQAWLGEVPGCVVPVHMRWLCRSCSSSHLLPALPQLQRLQAHAVVQDRDHWCNL